MVDFSYFAGFREIAIAFTDRYKHVVQQIYDECQELHPTKDIFLVAVKDIICSVKCDPYESYLVVGVACPLHPFKNAAYYTEELDERYFRAIEDHHGPVVFDSIYPVEKYVHLVNGGESEILRGGVAGPGKRSSGSVGHSADTALLVVTEDQKILDYYNYAYESVEKLPNDLVLKDRMRYLMKENINGAKVAEKGMFGIVFTDRSFESVVDALHAKLNEKTRAYKIFLKDISYERLISIDHIDCIVLVDCPVFQCSIPVHIPIISPFSVQCGLNDVWRGEYDRNSVDECLSKELVVRDFAADLMECKEFKGVLYRGDCEDDMNIHTGRTGTASKYDDEVR